MKLFYICALFLVSVTASGAGVIRTLDAPDTNISGLAFGDGKLWAVSSTTSMVYGLDPVSGSILESFYAVHDSCPEPYHPTGLTFFDDQIFACFIASSMLEEDTYLYWYTTDGTLIDFEWMC